MNFNIFLDPMFVAPYSGDYNLMAGSPCIDAGDPNSPLDPDGTLADIGALYFDQGTSAIAESAGAAGGALQLGNHPDPLSYGTTIRYRTPSRGRVSLTLYDLTGRTVRRLVDEVQPEGLHRINFDGRDTRGVRLPAGTYFYRLEVPGQSQSRRLTVLR
jgi:hypothetical protein